MKRWQTKKQKLMIGGLLLLLLLGSMPWIDHQQIYNGFIALSSSDSSTHPLTDATNGVGSVSDTIPKHAKTAIAEAQRKKESKKPVAATATPAAKTVKSADADRSELEKQTATAAEVCDPSCMEAKEKALSKLQAQQLKTIKSLSDRLARMESDDKKRKKTDDDEDDDFDVSSSSKDPIKKLCHKGKESRKGDDSYTLCAMRELGRLARLSKNSERPSNEEMKDLMEEHVYENLIEQIKEGVSSDASSDDVRRAEKAEDAIEALIEKLAGGRYRDVRSKLAEIKRLAAKERVNNTNKVLREANSAAATGDFVTASLLFQEYQNKLVSQTQRFNTDLGDLRSMYSRMVGVDNFSEANALYEYRNFFYQPYNTMNTRMWSGQALPDWYNSHGARMARANGIGPGNTLPGGGYYPPGSRGGPQGPRDLYHNGRFDNYQPRVGQPPVAGQRAFLGPQGTSQPFIGGQPQPFIGQPAFNGPIGANTFQGPAYNRCLPPHQCGPINGWTNNGSAWSGFGNNWQAPSIGWGSSGLNPRPTTNGLFGPGYGYGPGAGYYSGYSNYLYGQRPPPWGTSMFPGAIGGGAPWGMSAAQPRY